MSVFVIGFKARLDEPEKCSYRGCNEVVLNTDTEKAQLLNCLCQCESTQILTTDCSQAYQCIRSNECWVLNKK